MKTFSAMALALCIASFPSSARADGGAATSVSIENQDYVLKGQVEPDVNGTIVRPFLGRFGAYSFFYVDKTYAEAIVGPSWQPASWLIIAAGAGVEQGDQTAGTGSWRAGGMIWLGFERYVSTTYVETGASGPWAREEFAWKPRTWIGLGALGDTAVGYGPRVEIDVPKTPFQAWGAMLYAKDGDGVVPAFGFRLNI